MINLNAVRLLQQMKMVPYNIERRRSYYRRFNWHNNAMSHVTYCALSRDSPVALFWKVAGNLILTSKIGYFWSHGARIVAYTIIVKISVRGMGLGM